MSAVAAVVFQSRTAAPFGARFAWRDGPRAPGVRHITRTRRQIAAMRVVITVGHQVERPLAQVFDRLGHFAIVPSQGAIDEVEERDLLHSHHLPVPLQTAQIDGAQLRVGGIAEQRVVAAESEFVVPRHPFLRRIRQLLPHGVGVVAPLQELFETGLELLVPGQGKGRVHIGLRLHAVQPAGHHPVRALKVVGVPAPPASRFAVHVAQHPTVVLDVRGDVRNVFGGTRLLRSPGREIVKQADRVHVRVHFVARRVAFPEPKPVRRRIPLGRQSA